MLNGNPIVLNLASLLALLCLLPSCASVRPGDVQEYRNFPEYGGYLPLVPDGKGHTVRADWVLPVEDADGRVTMKLPSTPEEAEQRVRSRARRERNTNIVLAPAWLLAPFILIYNAVDYSRSREDREKKPDRFLEFAGVKVDLRIVDPRGREIPDANVYELSSLSEFFSYADHQGARAFGPPARDFYEPGQKLLALKAKYIPLYLGRSIAWKKGTTRLLGSTDSSFHRAERGTGHIAYTSNAFWQFARYKDGSVWEWATAPGDMTLRFVAWAPGYDPKLYPVFGVKPKSTVTGKISLQPLPNSRKIQQAAKRFDAIIDILAQGEEKQVFNGLSLNKPLFINKWFFPEGEFESAKEQLFAWSKDADLPSYFRWNVYELLRSLRWVTYDEEIEAFLERNEARARTYSRSVIEGPSSPWVFSEDLWQWESNLCAGKGSSDGSNRLTPPEEIVAEARSLLKRGEAIDPRDPRLQILRAAIVLGEGNRVRALPLLRTVDHNRFFELYYQCKLSLKGPFKRP